MVGTSPPACRGPGLSRLPGGCLWTRRGINPGRSAALIVQNGRNQPRRDLHSRPKLTCRKLVMFALDDAARSGIGNVPSWVDLATTVRGLALESRSRSQHLVDFYKCDPPFFPRATQHLDSQWPHVQLLCVPRSRNHPPAMPEYCTQIRVCAARGSIMQASAHEFRT